MMVEVEGEGFSDVRWLDGKTKEEWETPCTSRKPEREAPLYKPVVFRVYVSFSGHTSREMNRRFSSDPREGVLKSG